MAEQVEEAKGVRDSEGFVHDREIETVSRMTCLQAAAQNDSDSIVRVLLDHDADPNAVGRGQSDDATPLFYAALHGNLKMLQSLLHHNADLGAQDGAVWYHSLRGACWNGHTEVVKILLAHSGIIKVREPE